MTGPDCLLSKTCVLTLSANSTYKPGRPVATRSLTTPQPVTQNDVSRLFPSRLANGPLVTSPVWLDHFCDWLKVTPLSIALQSTSWAVPLVQTVHILAIGAVIGSGLMIALRTIGWVAPDQTLASTNLRFLRVIWWSLPILLVTGLLMISAEPARSLENPAFLLKMALLVFSVAVSVAYQTPLKRDPGFWELSRGRRRIGQMLAFVSLALWITVIFSGRWIAYVEAS